MIPVQPTIQRVIPHILDGQWDQWHGRYSPTEPCCVGAKIAHALNVARGDNDDFIRGLTQLQDTLGISRAELTHLFRSAGAPQNPFSIRDWPIDLDTFTGNLAGIEQVPALDGADLNGERLDGDNLQGKSLRHTGLRFARLIGANLSGADLTCADLTRANLTNARLDRADLSFARLEDAILDNVSVQDAILPSRYQRLVKNGKINHNG